MIYCFGDSFTYGDELADKQHAWPAVLGKIIQGLSVNYGQGGASNSWILKKAVQKCMENKPDIAVVAWTSANRYEFFQPDNRSLCINPGHIDRLYFADTLYKHWHNDVGKFIEWICQCILLQNFFVANNIEYYFANVFSIVELLEENTDNAELQSWLDKLNTDRFMGWSDETLMTWSNNTPIGPGGHPLEQGHQRIAEKIYEHIRR